MTDLGGRPREHNREEIFKELIEWAKKDDSINLCKFCCTREPPLAPSMLIRWAKDDQFSQSYETAKAFLGARREELLNGEKLHVKAYDLNATTYDQFLKEEKKEMAQFQSELNQKENEKGSTTNNIYVHPDLASGSNIPAAPVSNPSDNISKLRH